MIEIPKAYTKLLIYCSKSKVISWQLGMFGIYMDSFRVLKTTATNNIVDTSPSIVGINYETPENVYDFIRTSQLKSIRIFKSTRFGEHLPKGFLYTVGKNILGLMSTNKESKAFKITSNSDELRDEFYKIISSINTEFSYGHTFDYDKYDYEIFLRLFKDGKKNFLITYINGPGYLNISPAGI